MNDFKFNPSTKKFVGLPLNNFLTVSFGLFFLVLGLSARLRNYFGDLSLWCDEAALALNILGCDIWDLLGPLDMNQVAPIGFCFLTKLIVSLFGNNEISLRLLPFVAGTTSLFLAFFLVRRILGVWPALLCMAQLAVSDEAIAYANNFKPYASDLAIALFLMLSAFKNQDMKTSWSRFGKTGVWGGLAIWFSFPSVFILGGIGTLWALKLLRHKDCNRLWPLGTVSFIWLASFYIQYSFLEGQTQNHALQNFWQRYWMPFPPQGWNDLYFFHEVLPGVFKNPLRTWHGVVSSFLFLGGSLLMWRRQREGLFLILTPLLLNLMASWLHKYPFGDRMLLYGFINLFMPIAAMLTWLINRKGRWQWIKYAAIILIILNLAKPMSFTVKRLIWPKEVEQMKQVVTYIVDHYQPQDAFLVHAGANSTFFYYQDRFQLKPTSIRISQCFAPQSLPKIPFEIGEMTGRVWLIFGEGKKIGETDYEKVFVEEALKQGRLVEEYIDTGASAYLFSFP